MRSGRFTRSASLTSSTRVCPSSSYAPPSSGDTSGGSIDPFVGQAAHHFLRQFLRRDQPGRSAELVDDDGHVRPLAAHLVEQIADAAALGHDQGRPDHVNFSQWAVRDIGIIDHVRQHLLHADDAADVIQIAFVDGEARVA